MEPTLRPLSDSERLDWLRLARSENVGPVTFRRLIDRFGSARRALERLPDLARKGGRRTYRPCPLDLAEEELARLTKMGGRALAWIEPDYPAPLRAVDDAPAILTLRGRVDLLTRPRQVALVGARNASANGRRFAHDLARELASAGVVVVSGLARGIDGAAHAGALAASGGTIAVLAGGVDVLYPPEHADLYDRMTRDGLIVAEMPPGTEPGARLFPRRNRIISGLSLGTVVVEAALKSGSLITARFANEQGREVMAVPGSPLDPRCRGTNRLIREGALLVEDAAQVLEAIDGIKSPNLTFFKNLNENAQNIESELENDAEDLRTVVLNLLGPSPVEVDELLRQCHCSAPVMGMVLLELDLAGRLERHPGNRVSLLAKVA
ncbi:DNA-processing protein DprA [Dongia rigui]|uniref:DNA-processing protein DprA n=1 Tax=Dongia rigui TaxID=940149 RepID=A0ABU5E2D8_9PROT|nr:DNA-processing protein DprA [Dongia rigui]MDY0872986.1 DNA-processing protein DprA [Dongia rigui]